MATIDTSNNRQSQIRVPDLRIHLLKDSSRGSTIAKNDAIEDKTKFHPLPLCSET
jgi:hypothetical protein